MKINNIPQENLNLTVKQYYWEPILKEAFLMEEEDLEIIIEEVPQYYPNIKKILSDIRNERFN